MSNARSMYPRTARSAIRQTNLKLNKAIGVLSSRIMSSTEGRSKISSSFVEGEGVDEREFMKRRPERKTVTGSKVEEWKKWGVKQSWMVLFQRAAIVTIQALMSWKIRPDTLMVPAFPAAQGWMF